MKTYYKAKVKNWNELPKDEQWVYGYYVQGFNIYEEPLHIIFDPTTIFYSSGETDGWEEIDVNTLCACTVLTDKIGNKIWENDILFDDDMYSVVRWDDEEARFVIDDYGTKGCLMEYGFDEDAGDYDVVDTNGFDDFCSMDSFKIVGNIFDNPELLQK